MRLKNDKTFKKYFDGIIGYSDHTIGLAAPLYFKLWSKGNEKHFINSKSKNLLDSSFSSSPVELGMIVKKPIIHTL